ncbi:MAG: FAD synthase [Nitrosopumilaceae archaeon]|nr:FAD synthase [Nitrosopumilaceae archaeon]
MKQSSDDDKKHYKTAGPEPRTTAEQKSEISRDDKNTLCIIHACGMTKTDPLSAMSKIFSESEVEGRIKRLVRQNLVTEDARLTGAGRAAITVVLAGGVFDIIHHGHIHMLNAARSLGDMLVVVVASDNTARKSKRKAPLCHTEDIRQCLVSMIRTVDACVIGAEGSIFDTVKAIRPDVIALGYDQAHRKEDIEDGCSKLGIDTEVVRLESPMPDVSSSNLKSNLGDL